MSLFLSKRFNIRICTNRYRPDCLVFFLLSSFLITHLLLKELDTTGTVRRQRLYARRVLRDLASVLILFSGMLFLRGCLTHNTTSNRPTTGVPFSFRETGTSAFAAGTLAPFTHCGAFRFKSSSHLIWPAVCHARRQILQELVHLRSRHCRCVASPSNQVRRKAVTRYGRTVFLSSCTLH